MCVQRDMQISFDTTPGTENLKNVSEPVWPVYQVTDSPVTYIFFVQRASEDYSLVDYMAAFIT